MRAEAARVKKGWSSWIWPMRAIQSTPGFTLQLIATGMHLSPEFGYTVTNIRDEGFTVDETVETLLSSDSGVGVAKSVGLGVIGFADAFAKQKPDLIVVLGDRYETLAAAQAAMFMRLPMAHKSSPGRCDRRPLRERR